MISVVVVTFQSAETIKGCLASIPQDAEVVVVDNASDDGSAEQADSTGAIVVRNSSNEGFARAANQGARVATGEVILFLNPDAELEPDCIARLIEAVGDDAALAIVGPSVIRSPDGLRPGYWPFPAARRTWIHELALHRIAPDRAADIAGDGFVVGTCMLVRKSWFERLGGFDERFWLYGEDADLCWRASQLGGSSAAVAGAGVRHLGGHSSRQLDSSFEHFHRGAELFIATHHGKRALVSHRCAVLVGALVRTTAFLAGDRERSRWFGRLLARETKLLLRHPTVVPPASAPPPAS
jgi:GT2 family glycosyltransferase